MYLTKIQRRYLEKLVILQDKRIFNNTNRFHIDRVLKSGEYDNEFRTFMNRMNNGYKIYLTTGIPPKYYRFDFTKYLRNK